MNFENISISILKSLPKNARKHSKRNIDVIKKSLQECGQQKPIVVNSDNIVIAGNGTLESAKQLGWKHIWIVRTSLDKEHADLFAILDNRTAELAEWDAKELSEALEDLDKNGWDLKEFGWDEKDRKKIGNGEPKKGLIEDDEIPEAKEIKCSLGDIWELGDHRLMCGDSTDATLVERLMNGQKADMVFTDPPYNVAYKSQTFGTSIKNDNMKDSEFETFLFAIFRNLYSSSKKNSVFYICYATLSSFQFLTALKKFDWKYDNNLIWLKDIPVAYGKYKWCYEPIFFLIKGSPEFDDGGRLEKNVLEVKSIQSAGSIDDNGDSWFKGGSKNLSLHPTQKPVELIEKCLKPNNPDSVLDLFLGSGSTLIACEKTGRKCYGMEIDPHYCDVILKRWEDFTGKKAHKAGETSSYA